MGVLFNEVLHWTGKKWLKATVPSPGGTAMDDFSFLQSVSCTSASNCNAAGSYGTNEAADAVRLNQVLHWNGAKWLVSKVPNPDGTSTERWRRLPRHDPELERHQMVS